MIAAFRNALLATSLLLLPASAMAAEFTDAQRTEIGEIVKEYLLQNPEVLIDVSKELERRQQQAEDEQRVTAVKQYADDIFRSKQDYVAGNPQGDVTMVEFFDYNCGWCKKGMPEVLGLIDDDKNLRLVMKEFPIFGEDSEYAARAALAARLQDKYWPLHLAMLGHEGKITKASVDELAAAQGLDMARLKADMESPAVADVLRQNQDLAHALAINGTPAFIIDSKVVPGYLPKNGLAEAVAAVRSAGGCTVC